MVHHIVLPSALVCCIVPGSSPVRHAAPCSLCSVSSHHESLEQQDLPGLGELTWHRLASMKPITLAMPQHLKHVIACFFTMPDGVDASLWRYVIQLICWVV